ncbi:MAG: T9SS type A sorting domain-containing protein [Lewinellaceae bacterium]|nr:T9SS type A sorting domain-containing protein [Lewinellaceae bacterium]
MKYHYIINASGQEVYREKEHKAYSGVKSIDLSPFENGIYFVKVEMNSKIQGYYLA